MPFYHVFLFLFKHYLCVSQYLRERGNFTAPPLLQEAGKYEMEDTYQGKFM